MQTIQADIVYCSSSRSVAAEYFDAARELGREIARAGRGAFGARVSRDSSDPLWF